jgi:hypothetical protein
MKLFAFLAAALFATSALAEDAPEIPKLKPDKDGWLQLFDGKTLKGWQKIEYGGAAEVEVEDGAIVVRGGIELTGVRYLGTLPAMNYEVELETKLVAGSDFFCGLTFPAVRQSKPQKDGKAPPKTVDGKSFQDHLAPPCCTLVLGGWGGGLTGISSIDHMDAANNNTTGFQKFTEDKWYRVRLRVTENRLEAWLNGEKIVDEDVKDNELTMRTGDIEMSVPFGISTWQTTGAVRKIRLRPVDPKAVEKELAKDE